MGRVDVQSADRMSKRRSLTGLLLALAACIAAATWAGCTGNKGNPAQPSPSPTPSFAPESFRTDVLPIINAQCGPTNPSCHSRVVYTAYLTSSCRGVLSLEDTALGDVFYSGTNAGQSTGCPAKPLYDRLLGDSMECDPPDEKAYVNPGVLSSSYLWVKLIGPPALPFCQGILMPFDHPIPPEDLDAISNWIDAGAPP